LQHTQDDIGPYRRRFWEAYFHAGHILDAWVALGEDAAKELQKIDVKGELHHARILGKISPNQCVLMLRMGHILFCDWSHQGRLRAIDIHSRQAPKLYQAQYELFQLRFATTLDFNQGRLDDPGLLHLESELGGWQDTARDFISQHLGITLPLADLMPTESI
jgi:EH_Signature domain